MSVVVIEDFDPLKLFVTGFDRVNTTVATLQQFFPNAKEITMPRRKSKNNTSTGYVSFTWTTAF
jgi:hypothetical protein